MGGQERRQKSQAERQKERELDKGENGEMWRKGEISREKRGESTESGYLVCYASAKPSGQKYLDGHLLSSLNSGNYLGAAGSAW